MCYTLAVSVKNNSFLGKVEEVKHTLKVVYCPVVMDLRVKYADSS